MQYLFSILSLLFTMHQLPNSDFDYNAAWKEVDSLVEQGLPKSALKQVNVILQTAKAEKAHPQWAKAVIMHSRLTVQSEEDGVAMSIDFLEKERQQAPSPLKQLFASYLAQLYEGYFNNHRYDIAQRTFVDGVRNKDLRLWSKENFSDVIEELYKASIYHPASLNVGIMEYAVILENTENLNVEFRPTLYEVLADRVLNYFNSNQFQVRSTNKNNVIKNPKALAQVHEFVDVKWDDWDTKSTAHDILTLYQDVLRHELEKKNREALADYDLKRIVFVGQNNAFDTDAKGYVSALEKLAESNESIPFYAEIIFELASKAEGNQSDSLNHVKALKLCEKGIKAYPNSSGAFKCLQLKNTILSASCEAQALQVFHSKEAVELQLSYKNLANVTAYIVKTTTQEIEQFQGRYSEDITELFLSKNPKSKFDFPLEATPDYNPSNKSITIPNPGYGVYAIVLVGKSTATGQLVKSYLVMHVSDLSFISYMKDNSRMIQVLDRWKGSPVSNVTVQLHEQVYDSRSRSSARKLHTSLKSDKQGLAKSLEKEKNFSVTLIKGKDTLDLNTYVDYFVPERPSERQFVEFYTDRAIYRPGQTMYFKGLLLNSDRNQIPTIIKDRKITVSLKDANYKNVASLQLKSNDFGSVSGHFVLPSGLLNGTFTIVAEEQGMYGQTPISVEEYKRPTYNVVFDSLKDEISIGQTVMVTGTAMTFAGTPVDNADVEYTIHRIARVPWFYAWRMPIGQDVRLSVGTTKTDKDGKFSITFTASPDESMKSNEFTTFNYAISASITDSRGETQLGTTNIQAAAKPYVLHIDVPTEVERSTAKDVSVEAQNANGAAMQVPVKVRISKLVEPNEIELPKYDNGFTPYNYRSRKIRPTSQNRPYETWAVASVVLESMFTTPSKISILKTLEAGVYKFEVFDQKDKEIKAVEYTVVTDAKAKKFPKTNPIHLVVHKNNLEPGEKLKLTLGNATGTTQFVQLLITKDRDILYSGLEKVGKSKDITLPITDQHRGDIFVQIDYIYHNRYFTQNHNIVIPWSNKSLDIEFVTFRDKTLPGASELYKLKIKGKDKDALLAEVVASMYDASLDEFKKHTWNKDFYPRSSSYIGVIAAGFSINNAYLANYVQVGDSMEPVYILYPALIPLNQYYGDYLYESSISVQAMGAPEPRMKRSAPAEASDTAFSEGEKLEAGQNNDAQLSSQSTDHVAMRTNLNETVFFFPQLMTDKDGNVEVAFKMNDALTTWKLMVLGHTQDLKIGYKEAFVKTQKNIMVFPNLPRFFRDADGLQVKAKVNNLTNEQQVGTLELQFFDALTMIDVTKEIIKDASVKDASIDPFASATAGWNLQIPETKFNALTYRITAKFGNHVDIEENTIPVLTNRILVTETLPIWVGGNETKTVDFTAFGNNNSDTKKDFRYTVEFTSHPVWYAIQAMPYLHSETTNNTISLMNRLFTNAVASHIVNAHPSIKKVFETWRRSDKEALVTNLDKNEELKQAILQETPWVQEAMSESQQKQNISVLFDLNNLANDKQRVIQYLKNAQHTNGGFPWMVGGRDDIYTTLYVLENLAQIKTMGIDISDDVSDLEAMQERAIVYADQEMLIKYNKLVESIKKHGGKLEDDHLDDVASFYIYIRSIFSKSFNSDAEKNVFNYYMGQASKYWNKRNIFTQANLGLAMFRSGDQTWKKIVASLTEKSVSNPELGMYWNEGNGFTWSQLPIERHARIMEFFITTQSNLKDIDKMKIWLLKNKQTNIWHTSKATVAAIYALLMQGEEGISSQIDDVNPALITVGKVDINAKVTHAEAGSGYIKASFKAGEMTKDMASIKVQNPNNSIAWGAAYYQYFEVMDKVTSFTGSPFKITKKYYKLSAGASADVLKEITSDNVLKVGDKVKVSITLETDRDLDFVHLKDLIPSGFEPITVLSGHKYQDGLYYYETVTDLATHFYFDTMRKGKYVFEYPVVVSHVGDYTGGITSAQCLYAPEFASHSEGIRVKVKE